MPELPEVEIVKQSLTKNIKGKKIIKVSVRNRNLRFKVKSSFEHFLKNKHISNISRFSKYLVIQLENQSFCIIHLGMSGTIHIVKNKKNYLFSNTSFYSSPNLPKKHNHIVFFFKDLKMIYNDPRRFGFFQLISNKDILDKRFQKYGPEPFDKKFNIEYVTKYLEDKNKSIKNFLIDQRFVSGIGNIYASEILYLSKIHPLKLAKKLNRSQCKELIFN